MGDKLPVIVSEAFRAAYPGAHVGLLFMEGVSNPPAHPALDARKAALEGDLRSRFSGFDRPSLRKLPILAAYDAFYRRFDKSYYVLHQLESVALKRKSLPSGAALVEAMFMAEIFGMILTAGHDMAALRPPLRLEIASGNERFLGIRGSEEVCPKGDMLIADSEGVISSVIRGPDSRTKIGPGILSALFVAYAPEGVGEAAVDAHLTMVEAFVRLISPEARTVYKDIV